MNDFFKGVKALLDAKGGAGHQFENTYNPAAKYGLQKPARDITLWGEPKAFRTENKFLQTVNPNAFRSAQDKRPDLPEAPTAGSMLGKGGSGLRNPRAPGSLDI